MAEWTTSEWQAALTALLTIIGLSAGAVIYLNRLRVSAIERQRRLLIAEWTNEGAIDAAEEAYVLLQLEDHLGDIIGSLESPQNEETLDANVDVGWLHATMHLSLLRGRTVTPVATVRLRLAGNDNRLSWKLISNTGMFKLPRRTILWLTF